MTVGRFDLLNPRIITALAHGGFASICFLRPNLNELFNAYAPFGNMPAWGVGMTALAVILTFAPRASLLLMIGHLISAGALWTAGGLLMLGVGPLPTAVILLGLGCTSLLLFQRSFGQWLHAQPKYREWQAQPPLWLVKRRWFQKLRERAKAGGGG